jgi:hypothetical protein
MAKTVNKKVIKKNVKKANILRVGDKMTSEKIQQCVNRQYETVCKFSFESIQKSIIEMQETARKNNDNINPVKDIIQADATEWGEDIQKEVEFRKGVIEKMKALMTEYLQ